LLRPVRDIGHLESLIIVASRDETTRQCGPAGEALVRRTGASEQPTVLTYSSSSEACCAQDPVSLCRLSDLLLAAGIASRRFSQGTCDFIRTLPYKL
jgi:hypothetical protein